MSNDKNYESYSVEDLLHDRDFIAEVKKRGETSWNEFLDNHPVSKKRMKRAKELIELFEVQEMELDENRKFLLWQKINQFKVTGRRNKQRVISVFMKIAAAIIVLFAFAGLWYLNSGRQEKWLLETASLTEKPAVKQSTLILADGNQVELQSKESITVLKERNAIRIDRDSVIALDEASVKTDKQEALNEVIVPYGEKTSLVLADGTKVWLNAGSRFAFPTHFSAKSRKVFLVGEAYFEVTKNQLQPFIVSTRDVRVKVYGTKFNVSAYPNDTYCETVLLEGSVSMEENQSMFSGEVRMLPGQKATFSKETKSVSLQEIKNPELYVSWREGWHQFSNVDLTYVTHKLERYYNVQFEYDQDIIQKSYHVSGKLDLKDSLDQVLSVIAKVAKVDYQISGNQINLKIQKNR